jgi:hypothetical protein
MPGRAKRTLRALRSSRMPRQSTRARARACARRQRAGVGHHAASVVVEPAHGGEADVEGAVAEFGEALRRREQEEHLGADRERAVAGGAVQARQLRPRKVRAVAVVDAVHLAHHRLQRALGLGVALGPQLDLDRGAHDRRFAPMPGAGRGARCQWAQRQRRGDA